MGVGDRMKCSDMAGVHGTELEELYEKYKKEGRLCQRRSCGMLFSMRSVC